MSLCATTSVVGVLVGRRVEVAVEVPLARLLQAAVAAGAINVAMVVVAVVGMRMRRTRRSAVKRFKSLTRLLHAFTRL